MGADDREELRSDSRQVSRCVEWDGEESVPTAIIEAVATVTEQEPTEMVPLSTVVDTDALAELFTPIDRSPRTRGTVEFEYAGCLVRVSAAGELEVSPFSER